MMEKNFLFNKVALVSTFLIGNGYAVYSSDYLLHSLLSIK